MKRIMCAFDDNGQAFNAIAKSVKKLSQLSSYHRNVKWHR
jgi:hypothetical protein